MKILYHHRIRSKDGQAVHLEELVRAMRKQGHTVRIVGPAAFANAEFGYEPGVLAKAKMLLPAWLYEIAELCYNVPAFARLWAAYLNFRPDFVYERYNLYCVAGIWLKKLTSIPILLEVNAPLASERRRYGGLAFPEVARALEEWTWRNASTVLPVTKVLADGIQNAGIPPVQIEVIPNGIDPERFESASSAEAAKAEIGVAGKVVVGFAGFARDWHRLDTIIALLARPSLPVNVHALIVGEGPAIEKLKVLSHDLGVADRVTFAGLIPRDAVPKFVAAFDIALLPSCVAYCSPLKLFEYMALGKAIVAPDQPNIREILSPGSSALLFAPGAEESMGKAVLQLVSNEALRDRLGRAARSLISARDLTWQRNSERVTALGAALVAALGRRPLVAQ